MVIWAACGPSFLHATDNQPLQRRIVWNDNGIGIRVLEQIGQTIDMVAVEMRYAEQVECILILQSISPEVHDLWLKISLGGHGTAVKNPTVGDVCVLVDLSMKRT